MVTEPIKREGRYVNGKLKTWKEHIKADFHRQDVPCNMHWNEAAVLKIDSVYKQGKKYHLQVYVEECKYTDAENQQHIMLSDDDDDDDEEEDGFFECKKEGQKDFCNLPGVTKLIINELNVAVRTCKKVEYTPSKSHENKGRA